MWKRRLKSRVSPGCSKKGGGAATEEGFHNVAQKAVSIIRIKLFCQRKGDREKGRLSGAWQERAGEQKHGGDSEGWTVIWERKSEKGGGATTKTEKRL